MKETEIEKLRQLISRTDMSGNQKVDWLVNFISEREQALRIHDVSGMLCGSFDPDNRTSSATKCKCGREKWEHPKPHN